MPVNRNALLRHQVIDRCLKDRGGKWTWERILNEVNRELEKADRKTGPIGKTTLYQDIKDFEFNIYNAEIERIKEGRTTYLRYADPDFSINSQPLQENETEQLKSAIMILSRVKGIPNFEWVN